MPSFAARWLLPRIGRFSAAHPDLDLNIQASNALTDFRRDDVDVAIRYGDGGWPGLIEEYVLGDAYFPVCSPRMAGGRLPARPTDLSRHTLLRAEGESWKPWFEAAGLDWPEPSRGPMFSDSSHMLQAAIEGQGVALARSSLIGSDLRNGLLIRVSDIVVPSPKNYYLVYPPRVADSPKIAPFRKWLFDEVAMEQRQAAVGPRSARRDSTTAPAGRPKPKRS